MPPRRLLHVEPEGDDGSVTEHRPEAVYPESQRATRDRSRTPAALCARRLAARTAPAAGVHWRPGQSRDRVRGGPAAGAILRPIALHLGHADRPDPDLPDDRLLRRRAPGRP